LDREFHRGYLDADTSRICNTKDDRSWRKVVVSSAATFIGPAIELQIFPLFLRVPS